MVRRQSSKLSPSLSPPSPPVIGNLSEVQKAIEGLEGKINGQALGAALRLCLRGSDGRAQLLHKHRVFPSRRQSLLPCGQRSARFRKTCYHSYDTDSVEESTRFQYFVNFGQQRVTFFSCEIFSMELSRSCCKRGASKTPLFLTWTWKWAKWTTVWAIWTPTGQNVWKVGKTFLEVGKKKLYMRCSDAGHQTPQRGPVRPGTRMCCSNLKPLDFK